MSDQPNGPVFIEWTASSAQAFLDALRLSRPEWDTYFQHRGKPDQDWQRDWIFRGQSSIKHELKPRAWREPSVENPTIDRLRSMISMSPLLSQELDRVVLGWRFSHPVPVLTDEEWQAKRQLLLLAVVQAFAEIIAVREFTNLADELGFRASRLPAWTDEDGYLQRLMSVLFPEPRNILDLAMAEASGEDVHRQLLRAQLELWANPAVALAQHHGIPTRLLDWTHNPITAAFFAANAVSDPSVDDFLVVYALHEQTFGRHIRIVEVPASENDFLRAQSALFTLDLKAEALLYQNGSFPSIEESIKHLGYKLPDVAWPKKYMLPISQAPELLRLLWLERTTQAHVMPSLDNVAAAVVTKIRLSGDTSKLEEIGST